MCINPIIASGSAGRRKTKRKKTSKREREREPINKNLNHFRTCDVASFRVFFLFD